MIERRHDIIEIAGELRQDRELSYMVYAGENDKHGREIWVPLPKSLVEKNDDGTFSMPEWLAHEKGLI